MADKSRPGILFYFDLVQPLLTQLNDKQVGQLFRAAFEYGQCGIVPAFEPGILSMAWALLQPAIDRDGERYNNTILQRKYAVYVREQKRNKVEPIPFDDFKLLSTDSTDNDRHRPITDDNGRYPTTTTTTKANTNTITKAIPTTSTTANANASGDRQHCADGETEAQYENDLPF